MKTKVCDCCLLSLDPDDCGLAKHRVVWVDADGNSDGKLYDVCQECLDAGSESGSGYRLASR